MSGAGRIAFVCPRFAEGATVGGAETLLRRLADRAAAAGRKVTFLTTCAQSHFTWENTLPPGRRYVGELEVHYFPVDPRDVSVFLRAQSAIDRQGGGDVAQADEEAWVRNNVNSEELCRHLREQGGRYDRLIMGPYLFGLILNASRIYPEKTLLIPCLHDEPFAWLNVMRGLFGGVAGLLFNTEPELELARRLFGLKGRRCAVVGMGLDPFEADSRAFASKRGLKSPYLLYSGRREPLKGTPLLCDYVQAFRERTGRDVKLIFTGSGAIEASPELTPHILDLGFVSEQEKHEVMAGAAAFIHPSVNESLGIVLLESWLARAPALVHAKSAVLQWQCRRSNGGLWFKNYPEFEEELQLLLDHEPLRKAMGEAGRKYVETEYAWPAVEKRFFDALE